MDERWRLRVFSWASGIIFAFGWWLFIDAVALNEHENDPLNVKAQLYLLGFGSTLSFIVIGAMDWSGLSADEFTHHGGSLVKYQTFALLVFAVLLMLTCIVISIWVLSNVYIQKKGINGQAPEEIYPGVAIFLQCAFIAIASVLFRVGRVNDDII